MITHKAIFTESVDDFIQNIILEKSKEIIYRATNEDFGVIDVVYRDYNGISLLGEIVSFVGKEKEIVYSMPHKNIGSSLHPYYIARNVHEYLVECYKMAEILSSARIQVNQESED